MPFQLARTVVLINRQDTVKHSLSFKIDLRLFLSAESLFKLRSGKTCLSFSSLSQTNPYGLAFFLSLDDTKVDYQNKFAKEYNVQLSTTFQLVINKFSPTFSFLLIF